MAALYGIHAGPAEARIICKNGFQINRGQEPFVSPYCADNRVAEVAREYGMQVSDSAVRNNPSVKERACRLVGDDLRARDACAGFRNEGRGQRY